MDWDNYEQLCETCFLKPKRRGARRATECEACHAFRMRNGHARPSHLIERQRQRDAARQE